MVVEMEMGYWSAKVGEIWGSTQILAYFYGAANDNDTKLDCYYSDFSFLWSC